ncbi:SDR family NAD(P)-dependent oxidoreductase [Fodinicurvata halophila]|uniref:SDR family NAD(P)-dependent oxidoreductase n=1 Tax=Fodinicurvata halophila TaxID=1419723 RepID=A0ABV8UJF2_9PROT
MAEQLDSFPEGGSALVLGASGGIGRAVAHGLVGSGCFARVFEASRSGTPRVDLEDEESIQALATEISDSEFALRLVLDATGFLHDERFRPERSWRHLETAHLEKSFCVNAIGPALLMKHLLPLFPRRGKAVFATLSARVGSIGDNGYGGWYAYRASKAALNQLVRTASIELSRRCPDAICVAVHPGTVETPLTAPYSKQGLNVRSPEQAATQLISVLDGLSAAQSGTFLDYRGEVLPW